jgi:hypothetical protein
MGRLHQNRSYRNRVVWCELDASGSVDGPVAGSCKHNFEPSGLIKGGAFLD